MRSTAYLVLTLCLAGCSPQVGTDEGQTTTSTSSSESTPAAPATPGSDSGEPSELTSSDAPLAEEESADKELIIDVRSKDEWDSGHLNQAIHIPHTEIAERIHEYTTDKDAKIVVYCAAGGRAGNAKEALEELGFVNVENAGGYDDVKQLYAEP